MSELTLLVHETKEEHQYDRERALRVYHLLLPEINAGRTWSGDSEGYGEHPALTDDGRIINLFELLEGSQFGDWIFAGINWDHGCDLVVRAEDE